MFNELNIKNMTTAEQEAFKAFVAEKCREALAPLYAELAEIKASYQELKNEPTPQPQEPQPTPEEIEDAKFEAQLAEMKKHLKSQGLIPNDK